MQNKDKAVRVIARLDIKGPNLIKGIQLEGQRVLGFPEKFSRLYYEEDIDELVLVDGVASLYKRSLNTEVISRVAEQVFVPLTVVGGIRDLNDMERAFSAGADRVGINSAAVLNPNLFSKAVRKFGSQSIVASVESFKHEYNRYEVWVNGGREPTGLDVLDWCKQVEDFGVGEVFITSINEDGLGRGFDLDLLQSLRADLKIPVLASGGAGCLDHFVQAANAGVSGIAGASLFHYKYCEANGHETLRYHKKELRKGEPIDSGNTQFLNHGYGGDRSLAVSPHTISEVKEFMFSQGIRVRRGYVL